MSKEKTKKELVTVVEAPGDDKPVEKVLVFPAELLEGFRGVASGHDAVELANRIINSDKVGFMDRPEAEENEDFKQIIPYVVVMKGREVLRYFRSKKGGESRLHGKWSIGVGGHINPEDCENANGNNIYEVAMWRELNEEISFNRGHRDTRMMPPIVGCIYDDSNAVGRVHFGIVHVHMLVPGDTLEFNDPAVTEVWLQHMLEIKKEADVFENWSKLTLNHILN